MDPGPSPSSSLPLHVVVTVLQFAVPEIVSLSEARLLCKGASSSLASPSFWRGMTVNLTRDEGYEPPLDGPRRPQHDESSRKAAASLSSASSSSGGRASAPRATTTRPRSNVDCLLGGIGVAGLASSPPAGCSGGGAISGAGTRKRNRAAAAGAEGTASGATAGRQFLRRYHHHVAFRRLTPPVTSTETIDTPVPLYPTCLDACGNMVALGTREGPVLLFDITSGGSGGSGGGGGGSGGGGSSGSCRDGAPPALETSAASERSAITPRAAAAAARVPGKAATPTTALNRSSNRSESTSSVTRVYGSLADGTGPTTAVLLDRAKVIAAGRGSRRSGGGFVIRIYAVDSTRLLRTLRCVSEVSRMSLFDPVLAVLSWGSGRLSFRDLYADGGGGLGQRTAMGVSAAAFAAVEGHLNNNNNNNNNNSSSSSSNNTGTIRPDYNGDGSTVLHCVNSSGTVFEASTSGAAWNSELIAPGGSEGGAVPAAAAAAAGGGWHVCADLGASLLVLATPWGAISGWRLHPSGRRARGPIFCFGLGSSCSASPSPSSRPLTSMSLAAGGLILATSAEGAPPRLWDMRLARRRWGWGLAADGGGPSEAGGARASGLRSTPAGGGRGGSATAAETAAAAGAAAAGSTRQEGSANDADDRGGRVKAGRARCVGVRPWPVGAWALGVAANAGSGRLISACSDGCMRITQLRSSNEEQRLRTAVLAARQAKQQAAARRGDAP
ncbi:unnamed protein product [Ectocarpus sp. 6 AP-2014]